MLQPRRMTPSAGKRNGMSVLLLVAAYLPLDLEECQTSASQEGHCFEPARDCLLVALNVIGLRQYLHYLDDAVLAMFWPSLRDDAYFL